MICDLHTHSIFSDGSFSPTDLAKLAKKAGLCALALTDHNTILGLREFKSACKNEGIESVCGVEFSTCYNSFQLHILALFVKEQYYNDIEEFIKPMAESKIESNKNLITKLNQAGYSITYEQFEESNIYNNFNRANIAQMLVEAGELDSVAQGFKTILSSRYGFYKPGKKLDTLKTIDFIKSIGAVSVIAHPFLNMNYDELDMFLPKAKAVGLNAIEVLYSRFSEGEQSLAKSLAQKHKLLESGGSDFHGTAKPEITLGKPAVPYEYLEKLKQI